MTGFINPLESLGLPRALVAEIWESNRTQDQKVDLLIDAAKAQVKGLSKAIHDDVIRASGKEPLDHYAAMNRALDLFEDRRSVPAFVDFWLDPEETFRTRMYHQAQAAAEVRERRITALHSILGSIDRKLIKGTEDDFEIALWPGVNKQYAVKKQGGFLDNDVRGDARVLKVHGDSVRLYRVVLPPGSNDADDLPTIELHDGVWKSLLNGHTMVAAELRNPIEVRIVGGLDTHKLLDVETRGVDLYRHAVASYRHSDNDRAAEDEYRQGIADPTYGLHDTLWRKPEEVWWLEALQPEVERSAFGHIVLMREDKDGEQLIAVFGLAAILEISVSDLDPR